jgi:hypothetical protein
MKISAIPAACAPIKKSFSVAGSTIANDQAHLLPESADELLFLYEALVLV